MGNFTQIIEFHWETRQKGLQIILLPMLAWVYLFLFPRGAINAAAEQSDDPQEEEKLQ